jgi:hypothetical protein
MYERQDELKPNATYWNEQCLSFFEQTQNAEKITECLLDTSALYLELSQIQHTSPEDFRRVAQNGDRIMTRAIALAADAQQPEVNRIASRFYYNLARPRDGLLSSQWDNNYLTLAVDRARQAYTKDKSDIRNVTQMSRSIQRIAANPPQIQQAKWTEELRRAQGLMAEAYDKNIATLRTPENHIPPANILAVITMDLARREWNESSKSEADAKQALSKLRAYGLAPQIEAWALVRSTEWAKDYTFDLNYDLARIRSVEVQILDAIGSAEADGVFDNAILDLKTAVDSGSANQVRAAVQSIDAEPSFGGLTETRRAHLRDIVSIVSKQ